MQARGGPDVTAVNTGECRPVKKRALSLEVIGFWETPNRLSDTRVSMLWPIFPAHKVVKKSCLWGEALSNSNRSRHFWSKLCRLLDRKAARRRWPAD
jgi:hypothetical protein